MDRADIPKLSGIQALDLPIILSVCRLGKSWRPHVEPGKRICGDRSRSYRRGGREARAGEGDRGSGEHSACLPRQDRAVAGPQGAGSDTAGRGRRCLAREGAERHHALRDLPVARRPGRRAALHAGRHGVLRRAGVLLPPVLDHATGAVPPFLRTTTIADIAAFETRRRWKRDVERRPRPADPGLSAANG